MLSSRKNKCIAGILLGALGLFIWGCSRTKTKYVTEDCGAVDTASITTSFLPTQPSYSVVYVDTFTNEQIEQINNSIANIISAILADYPSVSVQEINNINITITGGPIGEFNGRNHIHHNNILIYCGENLECGELYEKCLTCLFGEDEDLLPEWKNRGQQVANEHRQNR